MTVLEQKWKNTGEKGETFYQYFNDNKLCQIKGCMSADVREVVVGLHFHESLICKMQTCAWITSWTLQVQKKCKRVSEVAEKLITAAKKQEKQVILSLLNQEKWALLETYKKYAIGAMYYQMNMKQGELTVIDVTNSHIAPPNLSISVVFYIPLLKCLILLVIFFKIRRLLFNV